MPTTVTKTGDNQFTILSEKFKPSDNFPLAPMVMPAKYPMITALIVGSADVAYGALSPNLPLSQHIMEAVGRTGPAPMVTAITKIDTARGGGGTQSKCFVIKLAQPPHLFLKLVLKSNRTEVAEQKAADALAKAHLDQATCPLVLAAGYLKLTGQLLNVPKQGAPTPGPTAGPFDAILFEGKDASSLTTPGLDAAKKVKGLGRAFGTLYTSQLKKEGRKADADGGELSKVLFFEDFQASNVLLDNHTDVVYFIDNGGMKISNNVNDAYRNLREAIHMTTPLSAGDLADGEKVYKSEAAMLIKSFLKPFEAPHRAGVLSKLIEHVKWSQAPSDSNLSARGPELDRVAEVIVEKKLSKL